MTKHDNVEPPEARIAHRDLGLYVTGSIRSHLSRHPYGTSASGIPQRVRVGLEQSHNTLETFLDHADRTNLDRSSTYFVGTHYEYTVAHSLHRIGFTLERRGGTSDKGVDLLGKWRLPDVTRSQSSPWAHSDVTAFVQCKAVSRKSGPERIRELEGAFVALPRSAPSPSREAVEPQDSLYGPDAAAHSTIALLATPNAATKGVREAIARSRLPMGYLKIALGGRIEQLIWNRAAAKMASLGAVEVGTRFVQTLESESEPKLELEPEQGAEKTGTAEGIAREVVLTFRGEPWEFPYDDRMD